MLCGIRASVGDGGGENSSSSSSSSSSLYEDAVMNCLHRYMTSHHG